MVNTTSGFLSNVINIEHSFKDADGSDPPIENSNVFSLVADATKSRVRKGLKLDSGEYVPYK